MRVLQSSFPMIFFLFLSSYFVIFIGSFKVLRRETRMCEMQEFLIFLRVKETLYNYAISSFDSLYPEDETFKF